MLSTLERFKVTDAGGRTARLDDLAVSRCGDDYPPVTHLICKTGWRQKISLAWEAVKSIDWGAREILVSNLSVGVEADELIDQILLGRDVRDSMALDLRNRRAARMNDLWLEEAQGKLFLRGADMSARAIWRRITGGRYGRTRREEIYDWKYVEFLSGDPHNAEKGESFNLRIERLPPGEIALLSSALPYLHVAELLTLLPAWMASDVLEFMRPERQLQVFEELSHARARKLLTLMKPDVATALLSRLDPDTARAWLKELPPERSASLIELLRYPENTVGGIMTNEFVFLRADLTVREARLELREKLKGPDFAYLVYVVEDEVERRLCGVVSLRQLIIADEEKCVCDVMDEYVSTLQPLERAKEAAYRLLNTHLAAMPVVNHERRLLGVVTIDAALAQTAPSGWSGLTPRVFT